MSRKKESPGNTTSPGDDQTTSTAPILPPNGRQITSPDKQRALAAILARHPGNSCEAQRERILAALQLGPLSTFEAMRHLDCYHPPKRIQELRDSGIQIETFRMRADTEAGTRHLIGLYVLAEPIPPRRVLRLDRKSPLSTLRTGRTQPDTLQIQ